VEFWWLRCVRYVCFVCAGRHGVSQRPRKRRASAAACVRAQPAFRCCRRQGNHPAPSQSLLSAQNVSCTPHLPTLSPLPRSLTATPHALGSSVVASLQLCALLPLLDHRALRWTPAPTLLYGSRRQLQMSSLRNNQARNCSSKNQRFSCWNNSPSSRSKLWPTTTLRRLHSTL